MLGVLYLSINIQLPDSLPVQVQRRHVSMHPWSVCRDIFFQGPNPRLSIRLRKHAMENRSGRIPLALAFFPIGVTTWWIPARR